MPLSLSPKKFSVSNFEDIIGILNKLPDNCDQNKWLKKSLKTINKLVKKNKIDSLEGKILNSTLKDLEAGFNVFANYRHIRKITIFGSSRAKIDSEEYQLAVQFAQQLTALGFMVLTGAGGGIMAAGNQGAGRENSFGLNIKLPFEQHANQYIDNDPKLIHFRYFFTRKLFFLKETDAITLFPGGFGTQDEAFETMTLCQTGKQPLMPLILIDKPNANYWHNWNTYLQENLLAREYINPEDLQIYTITDNPVTACEIITQFYRVYHSSRYVKNLFVIRLNYDLTDEQLLELNEKFGDILTKGKIKKIKALSQEKGEYNNLPRIGFYFDQRKFTRLYQMINLINQFCGENFPYCQPQQK
jgi:hypothetical protein